MHVFSGPGESIRELSFPPSPFLSLTLSLSLPPSPPSLCISVALCISLSVPPLPPVLGVYLQFSIELLAKFHNFIEKVRHKFSLLTKQIDLLKITQLVCFYYVLTTFTTVGYGMFVLNCIHKADLGMLSDTW